MAGLTLGQRIFAIRGKESRKVFAEKTGVGTATLQRYENDERSPDISFLLKLQEMTEYSLDYLVHGHDVSLSNDEALILEKYRQADNDTRHKALVLLLGVNSDDKVVKNTIKGGVTNGSIGAVMGGTATIHNNESGFTQLPFLYACIFCCSLAWLLGVMANIKVMTDVAGAMAFGIPALVMWGIGIVMAIFGYQIGMEQHKRYNENKEMV